MAENRGITANARRRGPGKRFVTGQSGNPGGRPKGSLELRERAQGHGDNALAVRVAALKSEDERVRIIAANAILDRGYGKPGQGDDERRQERAMILEMEAYRAMSPAQLRAIVQADDAKRGGPPFDDDEAQV